MNIGVQEMRAVPKRFQSQAKRNKIRTIESESIDEVVSGGPGRRSEEASVTEAQRMAGVICFKLDRQPQKWKD